ncbi:MAG: zinc ribbon domain-containing protein [Chloroflexota bacterium]
MPIYPYICQNCGATFEELVLSSQSQDKVTCPSCGSKKIEKLLSRVAGLSGTSKTETLPASAANCKPGGT